MSKKVLWIGDEPYGALIDADEVENSVYLGANYYLVWDDRTGSQAPVIPATIAWEGEEYVRLRDMHREDVIAYLDSLVGVESRVADDWEPHEDILIWSAEDGFGALTDFEVTRTHTYFRNSNRTTIYLDDDTIGYELDILTGISLDYIDYSRGKTNAEYGGMGHHAILHKVRVDGRDSGLLLWHEYSAWQGEELDTGELVTAAEALKRLENHPDLDNIKAWLAQ